MSDEWLGIKEAAAYAGVHRHTIYRWVDSKKIIPHYTAGGTMRFKKDDLIRFSKPSKPKADS